MTVVTAPSDRRAPADGPTDRPIDRRADRWSSVGHARHADAAVAATEAFAALDLPATPELLVMFVSPSADTSAVAATIAELAPGIALIGCTSRGEISSRGQMDESVVLMALGGDGIRCATAAAPIVDGDVRSAAASAAQCISGIEHLDNTVMVLLVDGSGVDQDDIVRGAYDTVGPSVPLVGGCACGEVLENEVTLFHQPVNGAPSVPVGHSVVAAAITSTGPIGIGVGHGFEAVDEPLVVTSSGRNVVATLQELPALDAYLTHHGMTDDVFDEPGGFAEMARARPLGIARRGRIEPRAVVDADRQERTLIMGASVPQGGLVWLMRGDVDSALTAIDLAADDALAALDGAPAQATLVFDCGARRSVLGADGMRREVERIVGRVGATIAGFYTFGEVARTSGVTGFHNLTAVLLAFG